MVVAMSIVRVVQVAIHEIVNMVSVWNRLMAAAGPMHMVCIVSFTVMVRGTICGVCCIDCNDVLVDVVAMWVV